MTGGHRRASACTSTTRAPFKKPSSATAAAKLVWRENIGRFVQEVTPSTRSRRSHLGWDPKAGEGDDRAGQGGDETESKRHRHRRPLVKQMFGEVEQVLPVGPARRTCSRPWPNEFNKRAGVFVACEARVTGDSGDPAPAPSCKWRRRESGRRPVTTVVSTDHLFFRDTGYGDELAPKRYTIKKGASR